MTSKKPKRYSDFRSYINITDITGAGGYQERAIDVEPEPEENTEEPFLFPNEVVVAQAQNVLKFAPLKAHKSGLSGTLFITSYKVAFVTASLHVDPKEEDIYKHSIQSDFLGYHDICLTEIDTIYVTPDGGKRKKLCPANPIQGKIGELCIILKNMRMVNLNFRFTPADEDIKIAKALMVHTNPISSNLLYCAWVNSPPTSGIPDFRTAEDWEKELMRTRCRNWKVTKHNEYYNAFPSLPNSFIVPRGITDNELQNAADNFKGIRPPVWSWGTPKGAALVRMAQLNGVASFNNVENNMIKIIHQSHPHGVQPAIIDCNQRLPVLKAIQTSFNSLRKLHTPDSLNTFNENEKTYWSKWQNSGWLSHVQQCLEVALEVSGLIAVHNSSVVLQEGEGRDTSCIVSSLVQIILDPFARTLRGFHMLIQKEWVALGHPFSIRLGRTRQMPDELCPLWLLFLDCVHQIIIQCPNALEFTGQYLVCLWEASHCSLFSTCMFNCVKDKASSLKDARIEFKENELYMWPIWSWWGVTQGQRTVFQKRELRQRKTKIASKQVDLNRRASVSSDLMKHLDFGMQQKTLKREEQHVLDSFALCHSEAESRRDSRRRFINVYYVQSLLQSLSRQLYNIKDPITSAYALWEKICRVISRDCPYDIHGSLPSLDIDRALRVSSSTRMVPWTQCFGRWLSEPSHLPEGSHRKRVVPETAYNESLWVECEEMVRMIEMFVDNSDES